MSVSHSLGIVLHVLQVAGMSLVVSITYVAAVGRGRSPVLLEKGMSSTATKALVANLKGVSLGCVL